MGGFLTKHQFHVVSKPEDVFKVLILRNSSNGILAGEGSRMRFGPGFLPRSMASCPEQVYLRYLGHTPVLPLKVVLEHLR